MLIALAAAPILTPVVLLLLLRQSAVRAGMAGLAVAVLVVTLSPAYHLAAEELGRALMSGTLTTLMVSYVLLGGLLLYMVLREAGVLDVIAAAAAKAVPDEGRRALILVLGLSVFFESATGFGIGIVVAAPLFVALGYRPRDAAILALAGQCAVTWGALGIGTILGAELTGVPAARMGLLAAPMSLPLIWLCGGLALWLTGGARALGRALPELLLYGGLLVAVLGWVSLWLGVEVAGMIGGLAVTATGLLVSRLAGAGAGAGDGPPVFDRALARATAPFALLLAFLLITRLAPPLSRWLLETAVFEVPAVGFTLPLIYHPGFWLVVTALLSIALLGVSRARLVAATGATTRQWLIATLAVAGFLCFSQVMFAAGMTAALAEAVAESAGQFYVILLPFVGGLGGFLTASNAGSNAMFAQFQSAMSERLGLPTDVVAAAQNAAGANTTLASPGRVVLAAAVTDMTGREGELMRPVLVLAGAGLLALSVILWVWIG